MKIDLILDCLGRCDAGHSWLAFPDLASRQRAEFGKETATPSVAGATLYCIARGKASIGQLPIEAFFRVNINVNCCVRRYQANRFYTIVNSAATSSSVCESTHPSME